MSNLSADTKGRRKERSNLHASIVAIFALLEGVVAEESVMDGRCVNEILS
jgi:hypothetical protein